MYGKKPGDARGTRGARNADDVGGAGHVHAKPRSTEDKIADFGAACLIFGAKIAIHLKMDRRAFLRNAARAFDIVDGEFARRRGVEAEAEPANESARKPAPAPTPAPARAPAPTPAPSPAPAPAPASSAPAGSAPEPAEKPAEKPSEKPAEKPAEEASEKSANVAEAVANPASALRPNPNMESLREAFDRRREEEPVAPRRARDVDGSSG